MKISIIGGSGMLGHKLVQVWKEKFDVWATVRDNFENYKKFQIFDRQKTLENIDVGNIEALEKIVKKIQPDVIVNAVGIIKQIKDSKDIIKTLNTNAVFPHQLAEIAKKYNARLICISTDCVFDGKEGNYTEDDVPNADDLYGKSKNLGEVINQNCLTIRTSIIGRELQTKHSLVEWFLSNNGKKVKGFVNAIYSGFPTVYLAEILENIIVNHKKIFGLYHVSSEPINKFELLKLLKNAYKIDIEIERFEDFYIDRSLNSAKFREATGFVPPFWKELIGKMADDPTPYDDWKKT